MAKQFSFKILHEDKKTRARVGVIKTPHGEIKTPCFVPVGSQATIKSLTPQEIKETGTQIFFVNTYHAFLRPGVSVIEKFGGLGKFMGWDGPLMTDSGGFQIFSLAREGKRGWTTNLNHGELVKIDKEGVTFRSHWDGSLHRFTPEKSIEIQEKLGADLIFAFDQCPPYPGKKAYVKKAMERTHQWALRPAIGGAQGKPVRPAIGGAQGKQKKPSHQALFGIIQGGVYKDLRERSAKFISSLPFDGIGIGGVSVGESKRKMYQVCDWVLPLLPKEKPRHLLGVGEIDDIFEVCQRGVDMFDCVMPTRIGRMGKVLVKTQNSKLKTQNDKFRMDITKSLFSQDRRPIAIDCKCFTCQNFSRAYLNHLFRVRELLAYRLATIHNLYFLNNLVTQIRGTIQKGKLLELKSDWSLIGSHINF